MKSWHARVAPLLLLLPGVVFADEAADLGSGSPAVGGAGHSPEVESSPDAPPPLAAAPAAVPGAPPAAASLAAEPSLPSQSALTPAALYALAKGSVVVIRTEDSLGAGFLVKNRRLIATAFHVVEDGGPITIISRNGTEYEAEVYTYNEEQDLAVLELERDFSEGVPLPLRVAGDPGVGEAVVMVGHPFGDYAETIDDLEGLLTWTITSGIVGAVSDRFVQTDAASSPGNSGGPILDMHGQVLGVVSRRLEDAEGLTFSVPAAHLQRLLDNPGTPAPLKRQPQRRFGFGLSRYATSNDLWLDGLFMVFDRSPRGMGPRWGVEVAYNRVREIPEASGLFHFSEDLYSLLFEGGWRIPAPFGFGSFDPAVGLRVGWQSREELTLLAATSEDDCELSGGEPCALDVEFHDSGERGFIAFGVAGLSWNGDIGKIGVGGMFNPLPSAEPRFRLGAWAAVWF